MMVCCMSDSFGLGAGFGCPSRNIDYLQTINPKIQRPVHNLDFRGSRVSLKA
jgi:hypothetical protein